MGYVFTSNEDGHNHHTEVFLDCGDAAMEDHHKEVGRVHYHKILHMVVVEEVDHVDRMGLLDIEDGVDHNHPLDHEEDHEEENAHIYHRSILAEYVYDNRPAVGYIHVVPDRGNHSHPVDQEDMGHDEVVLAIAIDGAPC